jgi:hypothetical protein
VNAYRKALADERLRRTRQINLFRFQAVGVFLVMMIGFKVSVPGWVGPPLPVFVAYFALAAAVWWMTRRSERLARLTSLSIPAVDMPMLFLLLRPAIVRLHGVGEHAAAARLAFHAPFYYVLLLLLGSLALDTPYIHAAALVAGTFDVLLLRAGGVFDDSGLPVVLRRRGGLRGGLPVAGHTYLPV